MEAASRRETIRAGYNRHHSQVPDVEKYFIEGYCHLTHLSLLPSLLNEVPSRPIHLRAGSVSAAPAPVALAAARCCRSPHAGRKQRSPLFISARGVPWKCSQGHGGEEKTGVFTSIPIHVPQTPPD